MVATVIIDGSNQKWFRGITDNAHYHHLDKSREVWMEKGKHRIKVAVFKNVDLKNFQGDWSSSLFSVSYYAYKSKEE